MPWPPVSHIIVACLYVTTFVITVSVWFLRDLFVKDIYESQDDED